MTAMGQWAAVHAVARVHFCDGKRKSGWLPLLCFTSEALARPRVLLDFASQRHPCAWSRGSREYFGGNGNCFLTHFYSRTLFDETVRPSFTILVRWPRLPVWRLHSLRVVVLLHQRPACSTATVLAPPILKPLNSSHDDGSWMELTLSDCVNISPSHVIISMTSPSRLPSLDGGHGSPAPGALNMLTRC